MRRIGSRSRYVENIKVFFRLIVADEARLNIGFHSTSAVDSRTTALDTCMHKVLALDVAVYQSPSLLRSSKMSIHHRRRPSSGFAPSQLFIHLSQVFQRRDMG